MKNKLTRLVPLVFCLATTLHGNKLRPENQIDVNPYLSLNIDLLCFLPKEKSIVLTNYMTNLFTTANVTLQPNVNPHFRWDVGYRIGFGYMFADDKWDMALNLLNFNTHLQQCRSTQGNIGLGMFPIWSLADDIIPFDWVAQAKMYWKLNLNLLDLDFGRDFSWHNRWFLRPIIGLRSAWINQHLDVDYGGGIFANGLNLSDLDSTFGYDSIYMKNNFWGIGPRLGIEPQVNLGCGWSLYASACGTLTYGLFKVCQVETYLKSLRYLRNCSPHGFRWMIDAMGGISWKTFLRDRYALTCALGWEYHIFFDQVALKADNFCMVSSNRNLSLNGLAFSACLDF